MSISNVIVGNALGWWEPNSGVPTGTRIAEWRKARNHWLRAQGICGVIKNGKKSRSFPEWWTEGTEFWFDDDINEQLFLERWKNEHSK